MQSSGIRQHQQLLPYLQLFTRDTITIAWRDHTIASELTTRVPAPWVGAWDKLGPLPQAIRRLWTALSAAPTTFVDRLCQQTVELGLVTSATTSRVYGLLYLFHQVNSPDPASWLGGLPAAEDDPSGFQQRFGIPLPRSYREFCAVHNGFTQDGWSSLGLRPVDGLYRLEASPAAGAQHAGSSLLAFAGDGAGNERCYDLQRPHGEDDYLTVDWDHETRSVSHPLPFWDYMADLVRQEMTGQATS